MAEYIEREAVKAAVRKRLNNSLIIGWLISIVNEVPAADVVPVVHGRWVTDENGVTYCEKCRHIDDYASVHNYCPNCGARMDGK